MDAQSLATALAIENQRLQDALAFIASLIRRSNSGTISITCSEYTEQGERLMDILGPFQNLAESSHG